MVATIEKKVISNGTAEDRRSSGHVADAAVAKARLDFVMDEMRNTLIEQEELLDHVGVALLAGRRLYVEGFSGPANGERPWAVEFGELRKTRVLVANEPRSYREAIAAALQALRPTIEVLISEPQALDSEIERYAPHFVVCSQVTPTIETNVLAWAELYPEHGSLAEISVKGERSTVTGIELDDLLSLVDQTESLAKAR